MRREWERLWPRTWLLAGLEQDLAQAGDVAVFDIGAESIILSRTAEGRIVGVHNACQHRGNKLLVERASGQKAITCPYHGWSYGLDGRLRVVPDPDRFSCPLDRDALSLKPVRVSTWAGMVWINMDLQAEPLEAFLGPLATRLAPWRLERMHLVQDQTVALEANWKTVIDNFNEQYHVDFLHPQHAGFVDCANAVNSLFPNGHRLVEVRGYVVNPRYPIPDEPPAPLAVLLPPLGLDPRDFRGRVPAIREAVQRRKRAAGSELGWDYSALSDDQLTDVWQADLFPNVIMTIRAEELWVMRARPHIDDPNRCLFDKWTLRAPGPEAAPAARPDPEVFKGEDVVAGRHSMTITIDQDIHLLPRMQAGMRSRGFGRATLNDDESRVQHFHDWLDQTLWEERKLAPGEA